MKRINLITLLTTMLLLSTNTASAAWGDSTISATAGPWPIVIKTCSKFAGAICSLNWRNKEFINVTDHGRELQTAANFLFAPDDGLDHPETYNPTEAGSSSDGGPNSSSTSVLTGLSASGNQLSTSTQMAFWLSPTQSNAGGEPSVNTTTLSNYMMFKAVTIGLPGMAHAIEYLVQYSVPSTENPVRAIFENLTGYLTSDFTDFYSYDVTTSTLTALSSPILEQNLPLIVSTTDDGWAMGIYTPASLQSYNRQAKYSGQDFGSVSKWNSVFRISNLGTAGSPNTGQFHFKSFVIVGSLANVTTTMDQLFTSYQ